VVPSVILVYCFDKMKYFASCIVIVFHTCVDKIVTRKMFIELVEYVAVIEFSWNLRVMCSRSRQIKHGRLFANDYHLINIDRDEAIANQQIFSYLKRLIYFIISYSDNIYLTTTNEFICQNFVEIKMLIDIHLCFKCISSYFGIFDILNS